MADSATAGEGGLKLVSQTTCFGGSQRQYTHESKSTNTTMRFSIYLPPQAEQGPVPVIYFLGGLTCNDENFSAKAGAQRYAAARGVALVMPDTSPRGANLPEEDVSWDFGTGAGFYVNATQEPWSRHYNMYSYVTEELPAIISENFPVTNRASIMGHSMGGHGALVIAIRNPDKYASVSALSPIAHPINCPWGVKAFTGYLGSNQEDWKQYDATELIRAHGPLKKYKILIDQGKDDPFLSKKQLLPEAFQAACNEVGQDVQLRFQNGYDHSYFFVSTFTEDHINHHADALLASEP